MVTVGTEQVAQKKQQASAEPYSGSSHDAKSSMSYSTLLLRLIVSVSNRLNWANNVKILHKKVISVYYNGRPNTSD